jgi:16S rRNA (guanine966-N2)-methyltransferase
MDRTRQAVFSSLGKSVEGAKVLDLFAGGGSLGIEALSRGATSCTFVEQSGRVLSFLRENTRGLACAEVVRGDVRRVLPRLAGREFDLVLLDPPYGQGLVGTTLGLVRQHGLLAPGGTVVVEHGRDERPEKPDG